MAIIEEFVLKIKAKTDDLIRGGNEVESQKRKLNDDQKKRDKEEEKRRKKELDHHKVVKKDLLERIKYTKDLALKITGLGAIFSAVGIAKVTDDTLKQADALQFLSKETGIAATKLKALQDANRLGGGTAEGMTEAVKSAANDVAMYRLKGRSFSSLQGSELLAMYGYQAGMTQKDWEDALSGDAEKFLAAKMRVVSWVQKQSKEKLRGIDPRQAASQLALEAGMSGVLNATQDYESFQQNVAKRQLKAKQWESPGVRQIREELTGLQIDLETITSSVVLQAFAPEIHKLATAMGELKPEDVDKFVKKVQELVKTLDELVVDIYKISQDEDTKTFFKETGAAVGTVASGINEAVKGTIGWKNAIEGLLALRLLVFFGSLLGVVGLGAGAGVTGAFLAVGAAVGALVAGFVDLQNESGVLNSLGKDMDKSGGFFSWVGEKTGLKDDLNNNLVEKLHEAGERYDFDSNAILKTYQESGMNPNVLLAQAYKESNFNPNAISPAGARGFSQFMPGTAKQYGLKNPYNAEDSAKAQVRYMRDLMQKNKGDYRLALAAYNGGQGAADWLKTTDYLNNPDRSRNARNAWRGQTAAYQKDILESAGSQSVMLMKKAATTPQPAPRAPVIPVDYSGIAPLPHPLPPTGAKTTNNNSGVTMTNTFNIASTDPKAAAKEVGKVFETLAKFDSPLVNTFNGGYSE